MLPATLLAQMRTTVTPAQPGYGNGYGLGLMRFDLPCGPAWGHGGNLFTYTAMAFASSDGHRGVVLVNGFTGPSLEDVFTAMQRAAKPPTATASPSARDISVRQQAPPGRPRCQPDGGIKAARGWPHAWRATGW